MTQWVYAFGDGKAEGGAAMRDLLGGKGAGLAEVSRVVGTALASEDFAAAMASLATLRAPVDTFFDNVTVNCNDADLRENRLRLLSTIQATMDTVADFSKIEGGER